MSDCHPAFKIRNNMCMQKYFKKLNGVIIEVTPNHDIDSLRARFEECDINGNAIKKEKPKAKPKAKKKEGK